MSRGGKVGLFLSELFLASPQPSHSHFFCPFAPPVIRGFQASQREVKLFVKASGRCSMSFTCLLTSVDQWSFNGGGEIATVAA